ncbi:MAG TPA: VOC family protein [Dehalococcoidia bacterium]|nr:VOC family protein [Dehalococcoidia bacterium]
MAGTYLDVVSVPVGDQDRARAFYTEVLGFQPRADMTMADGLRWVQLAPAGGGASITLVTWFETMPPGSLKGIVLAAEDIRKTYEECAGRGLRWNGPIEEASWGTFATFDDPDGNGWVVVQAQPAA